MEKLNYKKLNTFIATDVIRPFYNNRVFALKQIKLKTIIKRKNPYLFKAKNIETAGDFAKYILDAFLSSQEETMFGDLLEGLAINICREVFNGRKAEEGKFKSVDLIFKRDNKLYVVGIKSGPNWGNSDQINAMKKNLKRAKEILKSEGEKMNVIKVNGCMYGQDNRPYKKNKRNSNLNYHKICGQLFWELISGDNQLYKKIIQPLDKEAKKRDKVFKELYVKKINEITKDLINLFYADNLLDWNKIVDYVSKKK
ncbi:cytosolic protein [Patescibacteria group bacterium]|nr:cytosolic protein [Patescibacteria group bacterium]MCG2700256.1 cytosolic protein [Candidatus Parcubacteria bacterium]